MATVKVWSNNGWSATVPAPLRTFYNGWENYQRLLLEAIAPLNAEQLALRVAPEQWSVWQLAAHMAGARVYWFYKGLHEGDPAIAEMMSVDHTTVPGLPLEAAGWEDNQDRPRSAGEPVDAFEKTWGMVRDCLDRWSAEDLEVEFSRERRGGNVQVFTRGWVVWHLMEHDLHHGGEMSLILGSHGLAAPDL